MDKLIQAICKINRTEFEKITCEYKNNLFDMKISATGSMINIHTSDFDHMAVLYTNDIKARIRNNAYADYGKYIILTVDPSLSTIQYHKNGVDIDLDISTFDNASDEMKFQLQVLYTTECLEAIELIKQIQNFLIDNDYSNLIINVEMDIELEPFIEFIEGLV